MVDLIDVPSPNFDQRTAPPDMIVLHYTGMKTGAEALERLCDPAAKVSAHYLVEEDGRVFRLVPEERRAWHAGVSFWRGDTDINRRSVGIEIVNPGHAWGYRAFADAQIDAVIDLIGAVRGRWTVPDCAILGHSDVAPDRKTDPGELFPWARLHAEGHGLWAEPDPAPGDPVSEGEDGLAAMVIQGALRRIGYDAPANGRFDAATRIALTAFQRHWAPHRTDGIADGATRARLTAIARAAQAYDLGLA